MALIHRSRTRPDSDRLRANQRRKSERQAGQPEGGMSMGQFGHFSQLGSGSEASQGTRRSMAFSVRRPNKASATGPGISSGGLIFT